MTPDRSGILLAIPVYNEAKYIASVIGQVAECARDILVIDDGSTDDTPKLLAQQNVEVIRHAKNRGYGRSIRDMIRWADFDGYDWLITMDCDEQHEPAEIPAFVKAIEQDDADVISGSRYLQLSTADDAPPADRQAINQNICGELKKWLDLEVSDAFCGFKAYRIASCRNLELDVDGYEFPLQFWVQAVAAGLKVKEIPIRLIYNDPSRTFGGPLNDPKNRLESYLATMHLELSRCAEKLSLQRKD